MTTRMTDQIFPTMQDTFSDARVGRPLASPASREIQFRSVRMPSKSSRHFRALLEWCLEARAHTGAGSIARLCEKTALMLAGPVEQTERWITHTIPDIREVVSGGPPVAGEPPKVISLTLTMTIDPDALAAATEALEMVRDEMGLNNSATSLPKSGNPLLEELGGVTEELDEGPAAGRLAPHRRELSD